MSKDISSSGFLVSFGSYLQEKKHYKNTYFAVCTSIDKCRIAEQGGIWYNLVCVLFT